MPDLSFFVSKSLPSIQRFFVGDRQTLKITEKSQYEWTFAVTLGGRGRFSQQKHSTGGLLL